MIRVCVADWIVELSLTAEPRLELAVRRVSDGRKLIGCSEAVDPGPSAGFMPGIAIVPETQTLFLGVGKLIRAYSLSTGDEWWSDTADAGFWAWERHGDVVLMLAELQFAAYDLSAKRLWSTFVEPPWSHEIRGELVELDVMGQKCRFRLHTGP